MGHTLFTLFMAAMIVGRLVYTFQKRKARTQRWRIAADELRLDLREPTFFGVPLSISGRLGSISVRVEALPGSRNADRQVLFVAGAAHHLPFELKPETLSLFSRRDVEIGHHDFDRAFRIDGREPAIFASLSRNVRRQLLAHHRISVEEGELRWVFEREPTPSEIVSTLERLVALAEEMAVDAKSLGGRLLGTASSEGEPLAKRRQLAILFQWITDPQIREQAIDLALASPDAETRLIGAKHAGARGVDALRLIAGDAFVGDELRAEALMKLAPNGFELGVLLRMKVGAGPQLRAAIAERLRDVEANAAIEPALIEALGDDVEAVRIAAARSLAIVGTIAAVEALHAAGAGVFKSPEMRAASNEAVRAIQARAAGPGRGGLSLAGEDDRGALSVAGEGGALSLQSKS